MVGANCMGTYTRGQGVIALSSGESEYYGFTSGMSTALGDVSLAKDWNIRMEAHILMDATAGIAIGSRRGMGHVKHIDTVFLWCQQVVTSGRARISKRDTKEMLADMMTKPLSAPEMEKHMKSMGFEFREGKHNLSLKA